MQAIEAITLKARRFQEHGQILTLFSKECGVVNLVTKTRKSTFSELLKVEAEFITTTRELKKCKNIQIIGSYQSLRLSLDKLQAAAFMLDFVFRELPLEEAVPGLYLLLDAHLEALSHTANVKDVQDSFFREWNIFQGTINYNR